MAPSSDDLIRRCFTIEFDSTKQWSNREFEVLLLERIPELRPVVLGSIDTGLLDATVLKIRQLTREIDDGHCKGDLQHSVSKAGMFLRDVFGGRFWNWYAIGRPQDERQKELRP